MTDLVLLILALGVGAALLAAAVYHARSEPDDIWEWEEDSYRPCSDAPRAITRVRSNQLDWEIK